MKYGQLLVDIAKWTANAQVDYYLSKGEYAAAERLTKRGLIVNGGGGLVALTAAGNKLVDAFCAKVRRVKAVE